ncbi:hypothetical protein SUGI_0876560 [Cryptomeria japonica]|nr:hypothetical protein SUGI_0876560 [Cryptomeria japonica]
MNSTLRDYLRPTVHTTNSRTIESSQPNTPIRSDRGQKFLAQDVFLSHSGKQKFFVRQLYRDLTNQGVSCFFDQDRESLPVGEDFPHRIFVAAMTCQIAVLLVSMDFLQSKWPMLELSAFVEVRERTHTNPNLEILPLFFQISPDALKNITAEDEKWKQLEKSEEKRAEWNQSLNALRRINGLKFSEGDDEVKFRDEIVKEIWRILPTPSPRGCRLIRIAGLYGIPGQGKTTLAKAFCNFKLGDFEGKVCHLEFSRGDSFERIKVALRYLTSCRQSHKLGYIEEWKGQRVLLVLDNVTEESIEEVAYYLKAELGKNSWILLSSRSVDILEKYFKIDKQSSMRVPGLEEEEAIGILLERTCVEESTLGAEDKAFAVKCAKTDVCSKSKYGPHLSKWVCDIEGWVDRCGYGLDDLLAVLGKAFDDLRLEYRTIFMLLTLYMPANMSPHKVTKWLAMILNKEITFIEKAVEDLCKKAFIKESIPGIRIHDLYFEFAQMHVSKIVPDRPPDLQNVLVLQLVGVQNMSKLALGGMGRLRSITLHNCKDLVALEGSQVINKLGDRTGCAFLREINVCYRSLWEFPRLKGLRNLEKVQFSVCDKMKGPLDCTECVELQSTVISRFGWALPPDVVGRKKLSKTVLWDRDAVMAYSDIDAPSSLEACLDVDVQTETVISSIVVSALKSLESCDGLKDLQLWNLRNLKELPSFRLFSNLIVLKLGKCDIREPPDLTCCVLLEDVYFCTLENLRSFPNF